MNKFSYIWRLSNGYPASGIEKNNLNVFGTFLCGGGSTMGYKLSGYNHLGGVELDKKVATIYKLNHNPLYLFNEDIRIFNERSDIPDELYCLDILDGSPPCSTFSSTGLREKAWGRKKVFREGQKKQSLDDLVFVYCDTITKLRPKVFILENVKGIISGNAKVYSKAIVDILSNAGYTVFTYLLNAASMGVPQKRERVFFIGHKKELRFPKLDLSFSYAPIPFKNVCDHVDKETRLTELYIKYWDQTKQGEPVGKFNTLRKQKMNDVALTVAATNKNFHPLYKRELNTKELSLMSSFPQDYDYADINPGYLMGMSVPPVMIAQIAYQINIQWFDILNQ